MSSTKDKIVVTGASGFLGHHLIPVLVKRYGGEHVVDLSSKDYDLMDPIQVHRMFAECGPAILIHLAAYSGGIGANSEFPADFFHRNILFIALMFRAAAEHGVKKLIFPIGGCSYPATVTSPIGEAQMWNGYPQRESAGYAMAKKMGIVASNCYRRQFGLNSVIIIPGNMYGEYDNFKIDESHVIPAMIRRFFEAKRARSEKVVLWGTGRPVRDFVYAGDVADVFPFFIESNSITEPVNISSGTTTSIKELAAAIKEIIDFRGEIVWDCSKPDGQMIKIFDITNMKHLGLSCSISLQEGLKRTIAWFEKNYDNRSDGIRL